MINLFFFLKFKSQLRRTRPDVVRQIDESLSRSIVDAGGKITGDRFIISAVFNEDVIGFWLDLYILIENLQKKIEESPDLFGYSLVISGGVPGSPELLCRFLANHNGVFADESAAKHLLPYAFFQRPAEWLKGMKKRKYGCGGFYRIKELKVFNHAGKFDFEYLDDLLASLRQENDKNILVLGPSFLQTRKGIYKYCNIINGGFPALSICFESIGIGSLVDIWSQNIRALDMSGQSTEEIDFLWEFLFRERIRDEVSEYVMRSVKKFLSLVFDFYCGIARNKRQVPVIVLENIHLAEDFVKDILIDSLSETGHRFIVLGYGEETADSDRLRKWDSVFDSVKKINGAKMGYFPKLSFELWEIIYALSYFGKYFSPELFQRLFEEDDKNPVMITKAFSILHSLEIIDSVREPRLVNLYIEEYARNILEDTSRVKSIVRGRLLSWAVRRNINPCYRLLQIIEKMDGKKQIDDLLLLKTISSDIVNKTTSAVRAAMENNKLDEIAEGKSDVIRNVFNTSDALSSGTLEDIEKVFSGFKDAPFDAYPIFYTQLVINQCSYYIGRHDEKESAAKAKDAILLGQSKNIYCLPQSYRLFALVCLTKQQMNETIEYMGFALASAEKNGNNLELAISAYYAAAAYFLYGDIYNSSRLARKSVEQALSSGHPEWADRSRFLQGRLEFELGYYQKAYDIFEMLKKKPSGSRTAEKEDMLAAWMYRCKVYADDEDAFAPQNAGNDAKLFEIEAAYLAGDYKKALELSLEYENPFLKNNFLYAEQADWRSGFAQCEHLYFINGEIQTRIISLYHSLALSRISAKGSAQSEESIAGIQGILRDERLCEIDPLDSVYFYSKYRILEQAGANQVDLSTAVSMAFKRLQRRAGRIEDIETRRQYLYEPRWNRELMQAAKEFKLI